MHAGMAQHTELVTGTENSRSTEIKEYSCMHWQAPNGNGKQSYGIILEHHVEKWDSCILAKCIKTLFNQTSSYMPTNE